MMKVESSKSTIIAILVLVAVALAFWMLLLSPKRKEASELATQAEGQQATLAATQATVAAGEAAKRSFPANYRQLVALGKAVPAGEETASLLVQTNGIADASHVTFKTIELGTPDGSASTGSEVSTPEGSTAGVAGAPPTEAEAALLPIGASIGPAGLGVMPYELSFVGSFFRVADFIHGIDSLVDAKNERVAVDGRLVTLDGFSLAVSEEGFPKLNANFSVTTYIVPPNQGVTAGATPGCAGRSRAGDRNHRRHPHLEHGSEMNFLKKGPELKIPDKIPDVKVPGFVADAYRELRERHLLPLVVVLLVAIVAVPIALGESAETKEPLPEAASAGASVAAKTRVVVAKSAPGLRDYKKRLDHLSSKDPFKNRLAGVTPTASEGSGKGKESSGRRARRKKLHPKSAKKRAPGRRRRRKRRRPTTNASSSTRSRSTSA